MAHETGTHTVHRATELIIMVVLYLLTSHNHCIPEIPYDVHIRQSTCWYYKTNGIVGKWKRGWLWETNLSV